MPSTHENANKCCCCIVLFFKAFPFDILGLYGWLLRTSLGDDVQRKIWLLSFCVNIWLALYHGFLCYLSSDASGQVDKEIRLKISGKWHRKCSFVIDQAQKRTRPGYSCLDQISLVNKGFIDLVPRAFPFLGDEVEDLLYGQKETFFLRDHRGKSLNG